MKHTQFSIPRYIRKLIEKKGGMMHAYANSKAHCTADWGQILINQLFALPSSKTQTAQSRTRKARDVLKCYCKMHKIDGRNIIIY